MSGKSHDGGVMSRILLHAPDGPGGIVAVHHRHLQDTCGSQGQAGFQEGSNDESGARSSVQAGAIEKRKHLPVSSIKAGPSQTALHQLGYRFGESSLLIDTSDAQTCYSGDEQNRLK